MPEKHLYRSCKNRILGGVCGGLGEYFEIDPVLIRLIVALLVFTGVSIVFYIVAWIIIPDDPACQNQTETKEKAKNSGPAFHEEVKQSKNNSQKDESRSIIGLIVIAIGILLLMENVIGFRAWDAFWPLALIALGLYFIFNAKK